MLKGTTLNPDDVVCLLPPGSGYASVMKIAVNAVMAGCKPQHLPVVMAGAKALASLDPQDARGFLMSTSAHGPLFSGERSHHKRAWHQLQAGHTRPWKTVQGEYRYRACSHPYP